jgi:DNA invertase Pin-like site-specific DNA recombinase
LQAQASPGRIAYAYNRISSGQQRQGGGIERQEVMARAWCLDHGYQLDDQLDLSDAGISAYRGDHLRRGALGRFLQLAEANQLGPDPVLLVEAIDRLSRQEPIDALERVVFALVRSGVAIVDLEAQDVYDRESLRKNKLVMLVLRCQAAHDYSSRLGRRLDVHWEQARERARAGKVMRGRGGRHPFWLEVDEDNRWLLNDHTKTVQLVFKLAEEMGTARLAKELNERGVRHPTGKRWLASCVGNLLHDQAVVGDLVLGKRARRDAIAVRRVQKPDQKQVLQPLPELEVIDGYFPAAVDRPSYERIQRLMTRRGGDNKSKARPDGRMRTWLQGLIVCSQGALMTASSSKPTRSKKEPYFYLVCRRHRFGGGCECGGKGWRAQWIHAHVLTRFPRLMQILAGASALEREGELDRLEQQRDARQRHLEEAQHRLGRVRGNLDRAMEESSDVNLLERLSSRVDTAESEVRKAQGELSAVLAEIEAYQRRPDPAKLLQGEESQSLLASLATGDSTVQQRRRMNELLHHVQLRLVLDASGETQRVGLGLGEGPLLWHPFRGEQEISLLAGLFGWPHHSPQGPGPARAKLVDGLIVADR